MGKWGVFVTSTLHIHTPTYAQALFSALTFTGLLLAMDSRRLPRFALGTHALASIQ